MSSNYPSFPNRIPGLAEELRDLQARHLYRRLRSLPSNTHLNFSSNDYLALSKDSRVIAAAQAAADRYGCGASASRLVCGDTPIHAELEARLAALTGMPAALVFPSGYQANLATIAALAGPEDVIFSDALNHASLIDGCRLSRATVKVYQHSSPGHLEELLRANAEQPHRRRFILSDALFSMDGDLAPVRALQQLAHQYGAALVVDEAHAIGVFGKRGGGVCQAEGVVPEVLLGTLSKSLGSAGGFVAASGEVVEYLINRARPFVFSTGLSPISAAAASAALDILSESPELGQTLLRNAAHFAEILQELGAPVQAPASQILPIILGENEAALKAAAALEEDGVLAVAIRPPTVPQGTARLRLSVTAAHTLPELAAAARLIATRL